MESSDDARGGKNKNRDIILKWEREVAEGITYSSDIV